MKKKYYQIFHQCIKANLENIPMKMIQKKEKRETNETSPPPNFMSQILPDNEITESINSLNLKQRKSLKS